MSGQITIQLPHFEGPLALLLYLIRKDEMDIMDIKIHEITGQYLEYIKMMKEFDIEVAGEFIAMAATLIQIKSRMLLPQYNENGEIIEQEDPRKELVQKLLEYQKYQEAAKLLYERPLVGRDLWLRGVRERLENKNEEIEIEESGLFSLISAYRKMVKAAKKRVHRVSAKTQSIASRILEMKDRLIVGVRLTLQELVISVDDRARQTLITFLSLLELGKLGFVGLSQTEPYADLWVLGKRKIEVDAISRVEEYDNLHSEDVAARLVETAEEATLEEVPLENEDALLASSEVGVDLLQDIENLKSDLAVEEVTDEMASDEEILAAETAMKTEGEGHGEASI